MTDYNTGVFISYDLLPEARDWKVGKSYRVKAVLRQVTETEDGASFEIIDATSLESADKGKRSFMTSEGYTKG